ncbi:MAG: putative baseplate assembly protein, partial [Chloroflexales bacterium]|nr:putative baseplate assembly protein [Chloroflexales bacterium]
ERDLPLRVPYVAHASPPATATPTGAQAPPPATATLIQNPRAALPVVRLRDADGEWAPERDLLGSDPFARDFVVEMHEDQRAQLRFGDGVAGRRPAGALIATYQVGSGPAGNVGAEAIAHVVTDLGGISLVRNPLPAQGGSAPEALEQVRQHAPQAFRVQQRAVTAADYAAVAERHPEVQKAAATRRWTGSWHTILLTVDRRGGQPVDPEFEATIRRHIERYRLAGHDLEIEAPRFVSLDIALVICVAPGYFRDQVQRALLEALSSSDLPGGRRGFFHPDSFTFGQPVYLSRLVATATQVPGVAAVLELDGGPGPARPLPILLPRVLAIQGRGRTRFQRWGELPRGELAAGVIELGRDEIARLDNDPSRPEHGLLELIMEGGQ